VSPPRPPQLGSVVWAELADANGFRKVRPAVVVSATADIAVERRVRVLAITTRLPDPLPDDHVLLPWDQQGKARSGLRRKCAAVASWLVEIPVGGVQQIVGIVPPDVVKELLAKVAATSASSQPTSPKDAGTAPPDVPAT
jgi:hypothetical protein